MTTVMTRLDDYLAAVAAIAATGASANRWITVTRAADGAIDVRIRPGMLHELSAAQIADEIRTALLAAVADHRRQYVQRRIDYFGSPAGAGHDPPSGTTDNPGRP
ncbi:hypothetical protein [Mangrovihabitans endophyticus]|uniref:Uncharacterized protein n=1 Tax=Mangrovihabitans endophyticus TaxID=1751298 RepID=A0A8J3C2I2_9ACTN|nr:hypothetical protein [Mangrovihabitans endophyticus]GGK99748.1 hypothetical protein GCM10012284_37690 [Mangrovihabitans endophyticus]